MNQMTPTELKEAIESTHKLLAQEYTMHNEIMQKELIEHFFKLVEQQKFYAGYM